MSFVCRIPGDPRSLAFTAQDFSLGKMMEVNVICSRKFSEITPRIFQKVFGNNHAGFQKKAGS
jgi:hypothetical protein